VCAFHMGRVHVLNSTIITVHGGINYILVRIPSSEMWRRVDLV
jgi:hypothetical protein